MSSFLKKFLASFLLLLLLFLACLFPFVAKSVQHIAFYSMNTRADELIEKLKTAKDDIELIQLAKEERFFVFYRIGLLDEQQHLLYDSHAQHLFGPIYFPLQFTSHPEIQQALQTGSGYSEEYSNVLNQKMIYLARTFDFHGKNYLLRLAFPYQQIKDLRKNFESGFILVASIVLTLFSVMAFVIIHRMTRPIRQIIAAIIPYQEGSVTALPKIKINEGKNDDFDKLATTLNSLTDKITEQLELRKEFVANASHELKTPITIISGFAETLEDNPNLPEQTVSQITQTIRKNCERMGKTIQNLLTLASIDELPASRLTLTDMEELCQTSIEYTKPLYPHATFSLTSSPKKLGIDKELMEVALRNLLDNAAKYGGEHPEIGLTLSQDEEYVTISVSDNGQGMAPDELERIFQRFYRVPTTKKLSGSGLGLSIVEAIIEKHGGKVQVTSTLGKGSTFTLYIKDQIL